jgi:uncharacterized repeat protein (TIGR01451 family)
MKNIKQTAIFFAAAALFAGAATQVHAGASNCQIIYGGGEVCQKTVSFTLDKKVQRPTKGGDFVDNLGTNDDKFGPGTTVNFRITVKNTGDATLSNVNIVDSLPTYLTYSSGGQQDGNNANFTIDSLKSGESKSFDLVAKVADTNTLPADKSIVCVTNNVKATQDGNTATDSTQLCIEKSVSQKGGGPIVQQTPPLKQTPSTGPEMLSLVALIPSGALGLFLNRKSRRA